MTRHTIAFDQFRVNLGTGELYKGSRRLRIQPKAFQVLEVLLERPGELVTREDFRQQLWPGVSIDFDRNLDTAVKKLRQVLNDSPQSPRFIETLRARGYRFIASVNENEESLAETDSQDRQPVGRFALTAEIVNLVAGGLDAPPNQQRPSVAPSSEKPRADVDRSPNQLQEGGGQSTQIGHASGSGSDHHRRRRLAYLACGLAMLVVIPLGIYLFLAVPKGPPANLRVEGKELIVTNRKSQELWRYTFPHRLMTTPYSLAESLRFRTWFGDLDGDSRTELLFGFVPVNEAEFGQSVFCFSETGQVKWQFTPGRAMRDRAQAFSNVYFVSRFLASQTGKVVIGSNHVYSYPFQIAVLDSQGRLLSEYWHSGHLLALQLADYDRDGREELVAAGVNNAYGQATLVVLELAELKGASLTPPDSPMGFPDLPPANEKAVVFFPKSCITRKLEPYNRASSLSVTSDLIEVQVSETHLVEGPYLVYQLNRDLEVVGLTVSDAFENRHKELEAEGKLDHRFAAEEIEALKQQLRIIRRR